MNTKISELPVIDTVTDDMILMVITDGETRRLSVNDLMHGAFWECQYCHTLSSLDRCPSCGAPRKKEKTK